MSSGAILAGVAKVVNKTDILTRFESDLWRSSARVRKSRLHYARLFLDFAEGKGWSKDTVQRFMQWVERDGYAPGTQMFIFSIVKRVFDAARAAADEDRQRAISMVNPDDPGAVGEILQALATSLPSWPMGKRDAPRVASDDVQAPALTVEEVAAMIELYRKGLLGADEAAFLAVATTYGTRREELARIRPEHLDWEKRTIYIDTCKGGDPRTHAIPPEIEAPLRGYSFSEESSLFKLSWMYRRIEARAVEHREGAGWHSLRRTLDTCLMDLLPEVKVKTFLRWKMKASSEMPLRYYTADKAKIDTEVFAEGVHPFLPYWRP